MGRIALACGVASIVGSTAFAQTGGGYLGPAVLSSGAAGVGSRSGQQVDLRFFAGVNGIYDSSVQPLAIDANGKLSTVTGLAGIEAVIGLYGTHSWKTALVSVDYHGDYRAYNGGAAYDGTDQILTVGYTWQQSRHWTYNLRGTGGIYSNSLGGIGITPGVVAPSDVLQPSTLLFDVRSYYVQGGMDVTYVQTPRTSYTFGGEGFEVWRSSTALVGVEGYDTRGSIQHKLNKYSQVGVTYQRQHFDFPKAFGQADIDTAELFYGTNIGKNWQVTVRAGVFRAEVSGLQAVALDPVIAALLGQTSTIQAFHRTDIYPSGGASLTRRFKRASLAFSFDRMVVPGNGVYLTSRSDSGGASYSYTGIRKVNLSLSGGYNTLASLGQGIQPYRSGYGGGGMTYTLPLSLHLTTRYDYIYQSIEGFNYKHTGYRAMIGINFSPGKVPLSLW